MKEFELAAQEGGWNEWAIKTKSSQRFFLLEKKNPAKFIFEMAICEKGRKMNFGKSWEQGILSSVEDIHTDILTFRRNSKCLQKTFKWKKREVGGRHLESENDVSL